MVRIAGFAGKREDSATVPWVGAFQPDLRSGHLMLGSQLVESVHCFLGFLQPVGQSQCADQAGMVDRRPRFLLNCLAQAKDCRVEVGIPDKFAQTVRMEG